MCELLKPSNYAQDLVGIKCNEVTNVNQEIYPIATRRSNAKPNTLTDPNEWPMQASKSRCRFANPEKQPKHTNCQDC